MGVGEERGRKEGGDGIRYLDYLPDVTIGSIDESQGWDSYAQADGRGKGREVNRPWYRYYEAVP